jgi:O-antigen/teichoic acid export membrane protein
MLLAPFQQRIKQTKAVQLSFLDQVLFSGCTFITNLLIIRGLGPQAFGAYIFAWSIILAINGLQWAFVISPMTSIGPKQDADFIPYYYGTVFLKQGVFTLLYLLSLWVGFSLSGQYAVLALPLALAGSFFACQEFMRRYFFATGNVLQVIAVDLIGSAGQVALLLYLAWQKQMGIHQVLWSIAMTSLLATVIGLAFRPKLSFNWQYARTTLSKNWHFGSWMTLTAAVYMIGIQLNYILSGLILGKAVLGGIRCIINLTNPVLFCFQGVQNIQAPKASHIFQQEGILPLVHTLFRSWFSISLLAMLIFIPLLLFHQPLILWLYGKAYLPYSHLIYWQILSCYALLLWTFVWLYMIATERVKTMFLQTAVIIPISILFLFLVTPLFKTASPILTTILINVLYTGSALFILKPRMKALTGLLISQFHISAIKKSLLIR